MQFAIGFFVGILANQVFGMLTRALPASWVRYKVAIEGVGGLPQGLGLTNHVAHVRIEPPRLRRTLMDPLTEYVIALVRLDHAERQHRTKWIDGDDRRTQVLLNGGTMLDALLFVSFGDGVYFMDMYPEAKIGDGRHVLGVVIRRAMDGKDADSTDIQFDVTGSKLTVMGFEKSSE